MQPCDSGRGRGKTQRKEAQTKRFEQEEAEETENEKFHFFQNEWGEMAKINGVGALLRADAAARRPYLLRLQNLICAGRNLFLAQE